jgi:hypothetical protein
VVQSIRYSGVYEPVVGKQADEQVLDVNMCEHGPTPVGRDKSGPYAPPTLACLQRVHTPDTQSGLV